MGWISNLAFGNKGGMSVAELTKLTERHRFSKYLPYVAYDPETKLYYNTDNTVGYLWECSPLCYAGEETFGVLEGLFRLLIPDKSVMQFMLYAEPYVKPVIDEYQRLKVRGDESVLVKKSGESFKEFISAGTKGVDAMSGIPLRNFRLIVSLKIPNTVIRDKEIDVLDLRSSFMEILRGTHLFPVFMEPEELIGMLMRLFNDEAPERCNYDESVPIRKQIIMAETKIEKSWIELKLGNKILRPLTPKAFPKELGGTASNVISGDIWGLVSDSNQVKTPFIIGYNVVFQRSLKAKLHTKCNLVLQQQGLGSFAPTLMRKKEEYLWAVDEIDKGTQFARVIPIVWVIGKNSEEARDSVMRTKRIWEGQGFTMQEDKGILPVLFISALPFGLYNAHDNVDSIDRDFIANAQSIVRTVPIQADFAGAGRPALVFAGRKGQVATLDVFDNRANSMNAFVCAETGAGKSFLVNYIAFNYYATGSLLRLIDIGGSYKKLCSMLGGKFIDFAEGAGIVINPFSVVLEGEGEDTLDRELFVIASIVAQMVYSSTRGEPSEIEMTLIKNAVSWAYKKEGTDAGLDLVFEYLNSYPENAMEFDFADKNKARMAGDVRTVAHKLAFNMMDYTTRGRYGHWFNGESNINISKDEFVVLELENLKPQRELFNVVTMQILNYVTQDLYLSDRSRNRLIIFDEAHQFVEQGSILKNVIEQGYRRARKYNGSLTTITQSIMDLKAFGDLGNVIMANTPFKFYLQSTDFGKALNEKIIDYDEFVMEVLKTVKSNKPKYSEIFLDTPVGTGVVRLVVDRFLYYIATSDPKEIYVIESLVKKGMSYADAIEAVVAAEKEMATRNLSANSCSA